MTLNEKIKHDTNEALKKGDTLRTGVLRFLSAELYNKIKEKQALKKEMALTDEETVETLRKEMKRRREALELFWKGGREDLVKKEEAELKVIEEYLPPPLTEAEIKAVIDELISGGLADFNSLMRETMKRLKGRGADGQTVGELIKAKIGK